MADLTTALPTIKRVVWIDYAKFIGIVLVICAHQTLNDGWFDFISAFDIPLFFFLSGYLFSFKKFDSYKKFLHARVRQLLVPYFLLNFVTYAIWLFFFRYFDHTFNTSSHFYKPFVGIFYGNGFDDWLMHCIPSWFIICLFTLENIYFLVFRNLKGYYKYIALAGFLVLGWADHTYDHHRWPWGLNVAIIGLIFYGAANIFKEKISTITRLSVLKLFAICICSLAVLLFISSRNHADMNENAYQDLKLFFIGAFAGIAFALTLSRILDLLLGHVKLFQYIALNTLFIMAFHLMVMSAVTKVVLAAFNITLEESMTNGLIGAIVVPLTVLFLLPLIYLCNQYFPYLVGKPAKPEKAARVQEPVIIQPKSSDVAYDVK